MDAGKCPRLSSRLGREVFGVARQHDSKERLTSVRVYFDVAAVRPSDRPRNKEPQSEAIAARRVIPTRTKGFEDATHEFGGDTTFILDLDRHTLLVACHTYVNG